MQVAGKSRELPGRVSVMGVPIDPWTMRETVMYAKQAVDGGLFAHFIGVNADKLLQMRDNPALDAAVRRCEVINADGASIVLASRLLGTRLPERVAGIDLLYELCSLAQNEGYGVYLLGAHKEIVGQAGEHLLGRYPGLRIVGTRDGYFGPDEYGEVADELARVSPDITFVGITSPKKEELIEFFRHRGLTGVFVGVGGSFDVVSGSLARAPLWMQRMGLEWLFRLVQEPGRLFARYAVGNARFLCLVLREMGLMLRGRS